MPLEVTKGRLLDIAKPAGVDVSDADADVGDVKTPRTFYSVAAPRKTGTHALVSIDGYKNNNDTERTAPSQPASPTKVKEIKLNEDFSGGIRIKFDAKKTNTFAVMYGRVYRNGVSIGTQWSFDGGASTEYVTRTEDFDGISWSANDLIQVYVWFASNGGGGVAYVKNFQFFYEYETTAISTTNQDP